MSEWIELTGNAPPYFGDKWIDIKLSDGRVEEAFQYAYYSSRFKELWHRKGRATDIVAYRFSEDQEQ
jgi:hypothetical protein